MPTPTATATLLHTGTSTRTLTVRSTSTPITFRCAPLSSYGIGCVHGIGGSGGLTLLLLSTIESRAEATGALLLFAAGTAISMALISTVFGFVIAGGPIARNFERVAPVLGIMSMAFGAWYALGALEIIPYPF